MRSFYEILTDEELFTLLPYDRIAEREFYKRYKKKVVNIIKKYKLNSLEREDLIQEGMIGLFKAIHTFNEGLGIKFSTYSKKCIENQIKNALNTFWKYKLNEVSSDEKIDELIELRSPELKAIEEDYNDRIMDFIKGFEKLEQGVIEKFLEGKSYRTIASELGISIKKVDNILSKIRKRLAEYIRQVKRNESVWNNY
ncbi:MAG: sigma-70 family RNA polymerase sigma factor [Brevinematia bacterium]